MKNAVWKLCWIGLFAAVAGCNVDLTPEPEKTHRAIASAANELADALQGIRDADSARAATENVDGKFASLCELVGQLPAAGRDQPQQEDAGDAKSAAEAIQLMNSAVCRLRNEAERLEDVPGLPLDFWKAFDSRAFDFALKAYEATPPAQSATVAEPQQFTRNAKNLLERVGYEQMVKVDFVKMRLDLAGKACERLQKLADGHALRNHIARGAERGARPGRRFSRVCRGHRFWRRALAERDEAAAEDQNPPASARRPARKRSRRRGNLPGRRTKKRVRKSRQEAEERMARDRAEAEKRVAEREKDEEGGDPNDPAYYDRLAELLASDNYLKRDKAIAVLLRTSPAQVTAEQKKKIARAFKELLEDDRGFHREQAIKGLVIWAGKYAGPILLTMLDQSRPIEVEHVIKALRRHQVRQGGPHPGDEIGRFLCRQTRGPSLAADGRRGRRRRVARRPDAGSRRLSRRRPGAGRLRHRQEPSPAPQGSNQPQLEGPRRQQRGDPQNPGAKERGQERRQLAAAFRRLSGGLAFRDVDIGVLAAVLSGQSGEETPGRRLRSRSELDGVDDDARRQAADLRQFARARASDRRRRSRRRSRRAGGGWPS